MQKVLSYECDYYRKLDEPLAGLTVVSHHPVISLRNGRISDEGFHYRDMNGQRRTIIQ